MAIKPFIIKTAELLEKENIFLSPLSGLDSLGIEFAKMKNWLDMGTIWIEGLENDNGQVVIRVHSKMAKLHRLPEAAKMLVEKAITVLEDDNNYEINLETMTFLPDINEPDDAPLKYTIELRLEKKVSSPEDAVKEIKKILSRPPESLESLLRKVECKEIE